MSSAAFIRKTLLSILQETILPDLHRQSTPCLLAARLPLNVPAGIGVREIPIPPMRDADAQQIYPEGRKWNELRMHTTCFPSLFCVVKGEADLPMGVTTAMLSRLAPGDQPQQPCGGYLFSLASPAYFLIPPGVPQRTGDALPWQRNEPHRGTMCLFNVRVLPVGALCSFSTMTDGIYHVEYSLLVKDDQLAPIMGVLMDESSTLPTSSQISQSLLLTLMLRLQRDLSTHLPMMTDGLYSRFPDSAPLDSQAQQLHPVVERAHEFIRLRLHEPLAPAAIAAHVRLSPTQLNRIIKASTGVSTMNYVTRLRMESAQLLLSTSTLSVNREELSPAVSKAEFCE